MLHARLDLLGAHTDRARQLVAALFAQHPHLGRSLRYTPGTSLRASYHSQSIGAIPRPDKRAPGPAPRSRCGATANRIGKHRAAMPSSAAVITWKWRCGSRRTRCFPRARAPGRARRAGRARPRRCSARGACTRRAYRRRGARARSSCVVYSRKSGVVPAPCAAALLAITMPGRAASTLRRDRAVEVDRVLVRAAVARTRRESPGARRTSCRSRRAGGTRRRRAAPGVAEPLVELDHRGGRRCVGSPIASVVSTTPAALPLGLSAAGSTATPAPASIGSRF